MNDQTKPDTAEGEDAAAVAADAATAPATDAAAEVTAPADAPAQTEPAAQTEAAAPAPSKTAKAKAAPKIDPERLTRLIAEVENNNHHGLREDLMDRLTAEEGAAFKDADNTYSVRMAGLSTSATSGFGLALSNWCNKARRTLQKVEG